MTKKRVAELEGAQLNAMVAAAEGVTIRVRPDGTYQGKGNRLVPWYSLPHYSSEWGRGGPIIERERITIDPIEDNQWAAHIVSSSVKGGWLRITGASPLIAAMRAFVASKLGDEMEVPE